MQSHSLALLKDVDINATIPQSFSGKNVFITGASGFLGKILIEKLLRSCPDIGNIYILLRPKHGKSLQKRLKELLDGQVFQLCPANISMKVHAIAGDINEPNLGISAEDQALLIGCVSFFYHAAASIRFDEPLGDAFAKNTLGTMKACQLALEMKHLDVFMHVSTCYCYLQVGTLEERLYPAPMNWRQLWQIVSTLEPFALKALTAKIIDGYPNTYSFTKALSEAVVQEFCIGKIPTIIWRPSIVTPCLEEPFPGWVDSFNGPMSITFSFTKGLLRSVYSKANCRYDWIPADVVVNGMIKATWIHKYLDQRTVAVYNASSVGLNFDFTALKVVGMGPKVQRTLVPQFILYPSYYITSNYYEHMFIIYFQQLLPMYLLDLILKALQKSPRLITVQRKLIIAMNAMEYFFNNSWHFRNEKFNEIDSYLNEKDQSFVIELNNVDFVEYFENSARFLMVLSNDKLENIGRNKRNLKIAGFVHNTLKYISSAAFIWYGANSFILPALNKIAL